MSIKSTTSCKPCTPKELPFPKLMYNWGGAIYWCLDCNRSLKITTTVTGGIIGIYRDTPYSDQNAWKDFTGSVCLENVKD